MSLLKLIAMVLLGMHLGTANDMTRDWQACKNNTGSTPDQTIEGCTRVIKSDRATPDDLGEAFLYRGLAYYRKHDYNRAIQDYDETIRLSPRNETAFNARGAAYRAKGDCTRAFQDYETALRLKPDYADALANREIAKRRCVPQTKTPQTLDAP